MEPRPSGKKRGGLFVFSFFKPKIAGIYRIKTLTQIHAWSIPGATLDDAFACCTMIDLLFFKREIKTSNAKKFLAINP
jgi:hypothetical protein